MHQNSLDSFGKIQEVKGINRRKVHAVILKKKAVTAKEIAKYLKWDINCVTPRICELKKMGAIVEGGSVIQDGFRATVYAPVTNGGMV